MSPGSYAVAALLAILALGIRTAHGQVVDPAFGSATNFSSALERPSFLQVADDGMIWAGGGYDMVYFGENDQWHITRFLTDGTPDPSFDEDGLTLLNPCTSDDWSMGMLLGTDGYAYMVGYESFGQPLSLPPDDGSVVGRVDMNGVLDLNYGLEGFARLVFEEEDSRGLDIAHAVGGGMNLLTKSDASSRLLYFSRLLPTGFVDGSFADAGSRVISSPTDPNTTFITTSTQRTADGGFYFGGSIITPEDSVYLLLARVDGEGLLEPSFATDGWLEDIALGDNSSCIGITLDGQGRLLVNAVFDGQNAVIRYLPDGERDMSFGTNGAVHSIPSGTGGIEQVVVDDQGRVIVERQNTITFYSDAGVLITSFGNNGDFPLDPAVHDVSRILPVENGELLVLGSLWAPPIPPWTTNTSLQLFRIVYDVSTALPPSSLSNTLLVFPSPAHDRVSIRHNGQGGSTLRVTDATGRTTLQQVMNGSAMDLELAGWPAGAYLLTIIHADGGRAQGRLTVE